MTTRIRIGMLRLTDSAPVVMAKSRDIFQSLDIRRAIAPRLRNELHLHVGRRHKLRFEVPVVVPRHARCQRTKIIRAKLISANATLPAGHLRVARHDTNTGWIDRLLLCVSAWSQSEIQQESKRGDGEQTAHSKHSNWKESEHGRRLHVDAH